MRELRACMHACTLWSAAGTGGSGELRWMREIDVPFQDGHRRHVIMRLRRANSQQLFDLPTERVLHHTDCTPSSNNGFVCIYLQLELPPSPLGVCENRDGCLVAWGFCG